MPIRGRYVRLEVVIDEANVHGKLPNANRPYDWTPVKLGVEGDHLIATVKEEPAGRRTSELSLFRRDTRAGPLILLNKDLAFFIPEHAQDPSRRAANEQLWLEATVPPKGPPRPIRLGVRTGEGPIAPLDLN
jgi:hypothetical protein